MYKITFANVSEQMKIGLWDLDAYTGVDED
jgi:hypothetical protein